MAPLPGTFSIMAPAPTTLDEPTADVANAMAGRLREGMGAIAVHLFGSRARGDGQPDSDFDLLVVVPESTEPRYRRSREARRLVRSFEVPKDIVVMTAEEWREELEVKASLASTVAREGILLDGR